MGYELNGRRHQFRLSDFNWKRLLDLAKMNGWVPRGTLAAQDWVLECFCDEEELADLADRHEIAEYLEQESIIVLVNDAKNIAAALALEIEKGSASQVVNIWEEDREETILDYVLSMAPLSCEEGYVREPKPLTSLKVPRWLVEEFIEFCGEGSFCVTRSERRTYADHTENCGGRA